MDFEKPPKKPAGDNIIPLINVVFLLLIFFLLAGTIAAPDLWPIEAPTAADLPPAPSEQATLLLAADGRIAFRDRPVGADQLPEVVAAYLREGGDPVVQVKADARARSGALLPVLEILRGAGVQELDLLAEVVN